MTLHPGFGAHRLFSLWLTLLGVIVTLFFLLLSLWWNKASLGLALVTAAITAMAARLYPPRYFSHWHASYTHHGLALYRGVFWHHTWHIPTPALCSVTWFTTPCSRKQGCGILLIKHSGGISFIPFLDISLAETLLIEWEKCL